ncbi:PadR family transcriptional regulator [Enterococcus sp. DIV1298c]|uniref:PadR family transcriptional regulator n=1 Tax=Candidatus Enterococcus mangumiae TaxID=2230878 RepID=A0ABZ2T1H1_9ENTE|nr:MULTISPECIES: PadR family transcriptional regulator [unclassified Enterococcus]MBO0462439.1 PadR family transcriptional regulator [Enterococcus sp. DIV1298c]MBO0489792.1 PadR family transcriptional regulator [Enterococcus sp. DIV1094]
MARKNTLRYILLGLLSKKNQTGYELNQAFKNEIGEFWQAKHSQIYPELAKMEELGIIKHEVGITGVKLEKKIYQLTEEGRILLNEWIHTSPNELPVNRDEFVLKLYFVKDINDPAWIEILEQQKELHEEKRQHLLARQQVIFPTKKEQHENYGHYLILSHAINRETEYTNWLTQVLAQETKRK